jgi:hypothetical protein
MNELILFLAFIAVAYIFMSVGVMLNFFSSKAEKKDSLTSTNVKSKLLVPEDSTLRRHFLTHLRAKIEDDLLPEQIDPTLRHYYEASIAAEFQKRLS